MRYEITLSQKAYFEANQTILFEDFFKETSINRFSAGYDLWRKHPDIKKMACNRELGDIIFQLTSTKPVRLLFDRIAQNETIDLSKSSFQGILMGVLVLPTSIIFFSPTFPLPVQEKALLIVYGTLNSVFTFKPEDPFASGPKKQGYVYGDALKSEDYPLIYR